MPMETFSLYEPIMSSRYLDSMNKKPIKEQEACVDKATIAGESEVFVNLEYFQ